MLAAVNQVKVFRSTGHKIGYFGDVLPNQSVGCAECGWLSYCLKYLSLSPVVTCNIYLSLQLTSLVTLGLLSQIGSSDPLESPKYKCLVSLDFVKSISRFVFMPL